MNTDSVVVVPWDFSRHALAALRYAGTQYAPGNIRVVCVLEPPNPYAPGVKWGSELADIEKDARANCIEEFFRTASEFKDTELQFYTEFGEPADEILRFAHQQDADLILMSTHGRTGLQRLFMGSVAQKIAAASQIPIFLLPNSWFEQQQVDQPTSSDEHDDQPTIATLSDEESS